MTDIVVTSSFSNVSRFSYADLAPEAESAARSAAAAIRAVTAQSIPEIGRHLLAAKLALPHGSFTAWAETELGLNARSARNYMAAAEWLDGKPETVSALPPTIIYALASPTAPSEVVDDVVTMAKIGAIDLASVRTRLDAAKVEQIELRAAQRRSPKLTVAELRERKERQRRQADRERAAAEEKRRQEDGARREALLPLAQQVASLGAGTATALFAAVRQYQDQAVLLELVDEILRAGVGT